MATAVPSEMSSCMKETTAAEIDPVVIHLHVVATAAAKELGSIDGNHRWQTKPVVWGVKSLLP